MATREFFVGQDYLGSAPAPEEYVHNEIHSPIGQAFFCPICSDIWARALIQSCPTMVRHRACERHAPGFQLNGNSLGYVSTGEIPGSLYLVESRAWNDSLPDGVVRRELRVTLQWAIHAPQLPEWVASAAQDVLHYINQPRRSK
jgi:hypothetical protein